MYGIIEFEFSSYEDIVIACTCPTQPKLIFLTDAHGYSEGQVNVMIYDPKPVRTTRDQFGVYADKFTDMVRSALPNTNQSNDLRNEIARQTVLSGPKLADGSSKDSSVGQPDAVLHGRPSIESSGLRPVQSFGDDTSEDENYDNSDDLSLEKREGKSELHFQLSEKNIKKSNSLETIDSSKKEDDTSATIGKARSRDKSESSESSAAKSRLRRMGHGMKKKMKKVVHLAP